jgi:hypothetical protein
MTCLGTSTVWMLVPSDVGKDLYPKCPPGSYSLKRLDGHFGYIQTNKTTRGTGLGVASPGRLPISTLVKDLTAGRRPTAVDAVGY